MGLLIWLGKRDNWSDIAFEIVQILGLKFKESTFDFEKWTTEFPEFWPVAWHSLAVLLQRPWFCRAWIMQEYRLAPLHERGFSTGVLQR